MTTNAKIKKLIDDNEVLLFMKGNPTFPQIREGIKIYSNWPTIPQLYIRGEFIGGADIIRELYESGELAKTISKE